MNFLGVLGEGCAECRPHYKASSRRTLGKGGTPSASNQGTKDLLEDKGRETGRKQEETGTSEMVDKTVSWQWPSML